MPADYGPAPDREAVGPFYPGDDSGLIHVPSAAWSGQDHWPGLTRTALMVVARLGSLAAGGSTDVVRWDDVYPGETRYAKFYATRSADGSTATLRFTLGSASATFRAGVTVPWVDGDHQYAWAWRNEGTYTGNSGAAPASNVLGRSSCTSQGVQAIDLSGDINYTCKFLQDAHGKVPLSAPSGLVVEYVASWWDPATPASPTVAQFEERFGVYTCLRRFYVGKTGYSSH